MAEDGIYEVERILARRRTRKGKLRFMVRWRNFGSEEDTWEPLENLGDCMELVEEFNRKTLKEGNFQRLPSLDSNNKKKPLGLKKKQGDNIKDKGEEERDSEVNKKNIKDYFKTIDQDTKVLSNNNSSRTKSGEAVLARHGNGTFKAQKRKRESDGNGSQGKQTNNVTQGKQANNGKQQASRQTNGPVFPPTSTKTVKTEEASPEKRVKRAHSVTGVAGQGSSSTGASNGMGSPLQRRRLNSSMSPEGLRLNMRGSPILSPHVSLSSSPYPKLIISPAKMLIPTQARGRGGSTRSSRPQGSRKDEESDLHTRRTASIVARRRLSHSSGGDDTTIDSRRMSARQTESLHKYKEIVVKKCQGYVQVRLFTTTPTRNALNLKALQELTNVFESSKNDDSKVILLSGSGSVFCSGLDLRQLQTHFVEERKRAAKNIADALRSFVNSLINCPKVIVVAVNGPAIGLGAAILPLCDIAYASDKAYFHLPYSLLGQTPEACTSHTFPQVLGLALAGEMLYGGRKLTALEACACGLVSHTFWPTSFMQEVVPRVQRMAAQPGKALLQSKLLMKGQMRAKLEYVNESECKALEERWRSPDFYRQLKLFSENYSDM